MTEKQWADFLGINEECYNVILNTKLDKYNEFKDLFYNDELCFKKFYKSLNNTEILTYFFYLSLYYINNTSNPNKDIIISGCDNIWLWADFNFKKNGCYGIEPDFADWIFNILKEKVYRLGRLEFEEIVLEWDVECFDKIFPKGTKMINVHVPATGPLNHDDCLKSYNKALDYFKLNETYFICESWLLAPCIEEIVHKESNIYKFKKDYTIFKVLDDDYLFIERIFDGNIYDDPNKYIAKTSLQKKAKERLLSGKKLSSAYGLFRYEKK